MYVYAILNDKIASPKFDMNNRINILLMVARETNSPEH